MTYMAATAPRIESIHKARLIAAMKRVYKRKIQEPSDACLHTSFKIPSMAPKFPLDGVCVEVDLASEPTGYHSEGNAIADARFFGPHQKEREHMALVAEIQSGMYMYAFEN